MVTFKDIKEAHKNLKNIVKRTPLERSKTFSKMTNSDLYLKLENLQNTGSFKLRGAYNKISRLTKEQKKKGVVCASAGNHAQGVAHASTLLNTKSTVFMPVHTTPTKILATRSYGADVILKGKTYDDAYESAKKLAEKEDKTFIHAFNDKDIIAGQGTIGIEIYQELKDVDVVLVPVGGGGLISGISLALKNLNPKIKVIGVEAKGAESMKKSLQKNTPTSLSSISTIADGIAVKGPGELTFEVVKEHVGDMVTVNDAEIAKTLYSILQRAKLVVEPAGAVSLAAVLNKKVSFSNKKVVSLISGGNIDLSLLDQVIEKGMMENNLLTRISITVPDKPKSLDNILSIFSNLRVNVQSIRHERCTTSVPIGFVKLYITLRTIDKEQIKNIKKELDNKKIKYEILS